MSQYDNITTSPKSHHEPDSRFCFRTRGTYGGKPEIVEFASVAPYDVYDVDNPMCVAPYFRAYSTVSTNRYRSHVRSRDTE